MRPLAMWAISTQHGLGLAFVDREGLSPYTVAVYSDEATAQGEAHRLARQQKVLARPVRVWVQQFPSMMYRRLEEADKLEGSPAEGCEYVVGA